MKKEVKRIVKSALTFALALTMIFGQFPSGLVLNAIAAPAEETSEALAPAEDGMQLSAGVETAMEGGVQEEESATVAEESIGEEFTSEPIQSTGEVPETGSETGETTGESSPVSSLLSAIQEVSELIFTVTEVNYLAAATNEGTDPDPSNPGTEPVVADPDPIRVTVSFSDIPDVESGTALTITSETGFIVEGVEAGDSVSVAYVGNDRVADFDTSSLGKGKEIINFDSSDFALSGNNAGKYEVASVELKCNLKPKKSQNESLDLGSSSDWSLDDSVEVSFSSGTQNKENTIWYGPNSGDGITVNNGVVYSYSTDSYEVSGTPISKLSFNSTYDNVVIKVGDVYYGPVSISFNYDNEAPVFAINNFSYSGVGGPIEKITVTSVKNNTTDGGSGLKSVLIGEFETELTLTNANIDSYLDSFSATDVVCQRDGGHFYYYYVEDFVGNRSFGMFDSELINDQTKPVITIEDYEGTGSSVYPILSSLSFTVKATDSDGGLKTVSISLYDGYENGTEYNSLSNSISDDEKAEWSTDITLDSINFGYQLFYIISALDRSGNENYYYAYYKDVMHLSDAFDSKEEAISAVDSIDKTFAILGTNANAPKITINSTDEYEEVNNQYVFYEDTREVSVAFSNMPLPNMTFYADGNKTFSSTGYNAGNHAYSYANTSIKFLRKEGQPFYSFQIRRDSLPVIIDFNIVRDCDKQFLMDSSSDVSISVQVDLDGNAYETEGKTFYDSEVVATIIIEGKNLPIMESFERGDLLKSETRDLVVSQLTDWEDISEDESDTKRYSAKYTFSEDKEYAIKLKARKSRKKDHWSKIAETSFVIDTVVPTINGVQYSPETNHVVMETGKDEYYYGLSNGNGNPTDLVTEITITEANFYKNRVSVEVSKDGSGFRTISFDGENPYDIKLESDFEADPNNSDNQGTIEVTIPGKSDHSNDGKYVLKVSLKDPVNHSSGIYNSSRERNNIIDTKKPNIKINVLKNVGGQEAEVRENADGKDYYKNDFVVEFEVDELNLDVSSDYIHAYVNEDTDDNQMTYDEDSKAFRKAISIEGEYVFTISGRDKAGNAVCIDATNPGTGATDHDKSNMSNADGAYSSATKVLDKTAPTVKLDVVTEASKQDRNIDYGNGRFFFNKEFTATFTVSDKYLDENDITVKAGANNDAEETDYTSATVVADQTTGIDSTCSENECKYEYTGSADGLYVLNLNGMDKAGNLIVIDRGDDRKYFDGEASEGRVNSYIIVVDTVAPKLTVKMDDFYEAELSKDGEVDKLIPSKNQPYQQKNSTTIGFTGDDKSPAFLKYFIESSVSGKNIDVTADKDAKIYGPPAGSPLENQEIVGVQIIWFTTLTFEDLAGNIVDMPENSNKIYLDITALDIRSPEINGDGLKPTIDFVAKASASGRGPEGNPLYVPENELVIVANINDNFGETVTEDGLKISSSGLWKVYYEIAINGQKVAYSNDNVSASDKKGTIGGSDAEGSFIEYPGGGPEFNNNGKEHPDIEIVSTDTLTFKFPKNDFNYNDVVIRIWAVDNAGNKIEREAAAYYAFGIDVSSPSISVSYDNNDAQNGKYFKANRTATVVVKERNFASGRTSITTQSAAHISGWRYVKDTSSDNGDTDQWIATVLFDTDGDYTLGVSTTDLVGHSASGVSWGNSVAPTEFTIDKTKPLIAVSFDNNNVLNGRYYNANRRSTIDILEHNFDAKDATVARTAYIAEGTATLPGVGAWSRTGDTNRTEVYFGADGDYTMTIDYMDLAGNVADTYVVDLFTIDTVAPDLEISGVEDKHAYNGNVAPSITYHDINCDKPSAEVKITGVKHTTGENLTGVRTDTQYGGSFVCDNIEVKKENDDIYTAVGSVRDLAGNETTKEVKFSVNRFGSTYELDEVSKELVDMVYTNTERTIGVREINVNELSKNEVTYSLNGNVVTLAQGSDYTVKSDNPGWWEYNYSIDASNFAKEGRYNITLSSEDEAGNKNTNATIHGDAGNSSLPIEFVIDKTAPSLIITGVEENGRYRDEQRIMVVRYEDNSFISNLDIYVNDKLVKQLDSKNLAEAGGEIEYTLESRASWQNVRVEAVDAASNFGSIEISRFLLTRNALIQFVNNIPLLIGSIAGFIAIITGIFVIILLRRRRRNRY